MIPRHSLPFGISKLLSIFVRKLPAVKPADIEKAYADALGVPEAVLLPSVRAGIDMLIRVLGGERVTVVGPVYTCSTVHEAMLRSGARMKLIDSAAGSFLMSTEDVFDACEPGCALVLSELYGISYDPKMLEIMGGRGPALRILDMAMGVPLRERMRQLERRDVALFSFGWGKPMYAGWGGIACLQDPEVTERIREIRAQWTTPESIAARFQHAFRTSLRTVMNQRSLYGISHEQHIYRMIRKAYPSSESVCRPAESGGMLPLQWTRPMTTLNRKLALLNLRYSIQDANIRRDQAESYHMTLVKTGIVAGPAGNALPQSHFPIRVPSAIRDKMCDYLRGRGIDTSTVFQLSKELGRSAYPHAWEASEEVIALPLGPTITPEEVKIISGCVKDGLSALGGKNIIKKG